MNNITYNEQKMCEIETEIYSKRIKVVAPTKEEVLELYKKIKEEMKND